MKYRIIINTIHSMVRGSNSYQAEIPASILFAATLANDMPADIVLSRCIDKMACDNGVTVLINGAYCWIPIANIRCIELAPTTHNS